MRQLGKELKQMRPKLIIERRAKEAQSARAQDEAKQAQEVEEVSGSRSAFA